MSTKTLFTGVVLLILVLLGFSSMYTVREYQQGIKLRFGKVARDDAGEPVMSEPGLHFKIPMIESVVYLDARLQTLDGEPDRIVTNEKKDLLVDTYTKWRVSDFSQFYLKTLGDYRRAETLLEPYIDNSLRNQIGQRTVKDAISGERTEMVAAIQKAVGPSAAELGIEVVDVRVKKLNFPEDINDSIFERMRAERERIATEFRSIGKREADYIQAQADREVTVIGAEAERDSKQIRAEADARAAKIYADAYSKNPEFYSFQRSLEAYRKTFAKGDDVLVIEPDSEFFKYMHNSDGAAQ